LYDTVQQQEDVLGGLALTIEHLVAREARHAADAEQEVDLLRRQHGGQVLGDADAVFTHESNPRLSFATALSFIVTHLSNVADHACNERLAVQCAKFF
jgi:hypothetical protein